MQALWNKLAEVRFELGVILQKSKMFPATSALPVTKWRCRLHFLLLAEDFSSVYPSAILAVVDRHSSSFEKLII